MSVLVTGASGFIGQNALGTLQERFNVQTVSLRKIPVDQIDFSGIDTVLHLAGKAHQMQAIDPDEYYQVNHRLTISLAKIAKKKGVGHFIFISSVKVYGDLCNQRFDETTECKPDDDYGRSKFAAEQDLTKLAGTEFIISIIRPALVYGPGVKGNLDRLQRLIKRFPFLPFAGIQNQRSMVYIHNLTAFILKVIEQRIPGIFLAVDQPLPSTSDLVNSMIKYMDVHKQNYPLPKILIQLIRKVKPALYQRLFESYIVDNRKTIEKLNFVPPYSFEEGIKEMVQYYKHTNEQT